MRNHFKNFDVDFLLDLYGDNVIASLTDTKGIIKYVSDAYVEISGYSREELIGQPQNIVRHPDMPSSTFKELWKTILSGNTWKGEIKNLKKNKEFYWVKATITPQRDSANEIIGYASVRQDITDKKKAIQLHNQIQDMLDNIEDGFLIFDKDFKIEESYSKSCLKILDDDEMYAKNIADVLFYNDSEQKDTFLFGCEQLFKTDCFDTKELYLSLLPSQHFNSKIKYTIQYKIVCNDKILVLLRDITSQVELERKIIHDRKMQKMYICIATHKEELIELIESFIFFLKKDFGKITANILKMDLHTFKGLFSQLEMVNTIESIHNVETLLKKQKLNNQHRTKLMTAFYQDIKMITNTFGHSFLSPISTVKVEIVQINKIVKDMQIVVNKSNIHRHKLYEILESIKHMKDQTLFSMLSVHKNTVDHLAKKLHKDVYPLEINGSKDILVSTKFKKFMSSLVHLFRNSMVHGIESTSVRQKSKKNSRGKIVCSFHVDNDNIILEVSDDGNGINIGEVIAKAIDLGLITTEKIMETSEQEILQFIFSDKFSTSSLIDEVAGRGVGLSSVKYELEILEGKVLINNTPPKGLSFIFTIPYHDEIIDSTLLLSNHILETTKYFLSEDIKLKKIKNVSIQNMNISNYYSTIYLTGKITFMFVISIDEKLLGKILKFFIENMVVPNKTKLKENLAGEVLNIIIGLSLKKLPKEYMELTLGTPVAIDTNILQTFMDENRSTLCQIITNEGTLELAVVLLN